MQPISLIPLEPEHHTAALQRVYESTPGYWEMYGLLAAPAGQGERDLASIQAEPGRYGMGILLPNQPGKAEAGAQLVGVVDFRLHWPQQKVVYLGMFMVAEPFQRQGIGRAAWQMLEPWLANEAGMHTARLGVEQFNPGALKFFEQLGFYLTGDSQRIRSGKKLVRLLYMEKMLQAAATTGAQPGQPQLLGVEISI
jgi:RimJ/RimL family protein N-acetyltransferase